MDNSMADQIVMMLSQKSGLPNSLNYSDTKPSAMSAISKRIEYQSMNTEYTPGNVVRIKIPTGIYGEYLDPQQSYLRFKINNKTLGPAGAEGRAQIAVKLDNNASCVIKKLEVYGLNGSQQLYVCDNYNVLVNMLRDFNESTADRTTLNSILTGSNYNGGGYTEGVQIVAEGSQTFIHVPLCPLFGEKLLPLGVLNQDLEIRITLETAVNALVCSANTHIPDYSLTDVAYVGQIIQCDSQTHEAVMASNGGMFAWKGSGFYHHQALKSANAVSSKFLIPFNFSSLRTIYLSKRAEALLALNSAGLSDRTTVGTDLSYQYQIGSSYVPQKPINLNTENISECLCENLRALHALNRSAYGSIINPTNFTISGGDAHGRHMIMTELETFSHDTLTNGTDTVNSNVFYNETLNSGAVNASFLYDFYAEYDCIITIDPMGNISTNY